jgi:hypothetical protein
MRREFIILETLYLCTFYALGWLAVCTITANIFPFLWKHTSRIVRPLEGIFVGGLLIALALVSDGVYQFTSASLGVAAWVFAVLRVVLQVLEERYEAVGRRARFEEALIKFLEPRKKKVRPRKPDERLAELHDDKIRT